MMNFYYDPIKGLQYEYLGEIIILDIARIPKDFSVEQFIFRWKTISKISFNSGGRFLPANTNIRKNNELYKNLIMANQYAPYEQALQLKELGFDEECIYLFQNNKEEAIFWGGTRNNTYFSKIFDDTHFRLVTPLYQQAFDWFREKGIYGYIHEYYEDEVNKNYTFHYHFVSDKIQALIGESSYTFSMYKLTYEEARLELLKKLIENLQNGNK